MGFNIFIFVSNSLSYVFDKGCCTKRFQKGGWNIARALCSWQGVLHIEGFMFFWQGVWCATFVICSWQKC
jgi:hypothetical protein